MSLTEDIEFWGVLEILEKRVVEQKHLSRIHYGDSKSLKDNPYHLNVPE
jgi:hypothetical protein